MAPAATAGGVIGSAPASAPGLVAAAPNPSVRLTTLQQGLALPWDLAVLPDGAILFTQRGGVTALRRADGTLQTVATTQTDLFVGSESGLMGLVLDPAFGSNRTYYTCQAYRGSGTTAIDIRVLRWQLTPDGTAAARLGSPVVTGIPITTGQHGGCRLRFAPDGTLHIGTGDAITGTNPQDLGSLGGKTLRVRTDGTAPTDNPFYSRGGRASLVWTYGHRNVQGLALRPGTTQLWSAEHGPSIDDEVNLLSRGGNYGWNPVPGYNQNVPMTDTATYPAAIRARWSSGNPTVATSGATFLTGSSWGRWEGALAVAELKNTGVRVLSMTPDGRVTADEQMGPLDGTIGRIRTVQTGPGGAVYGSTSNGTGDRLVRIDPVATPKAWTAGLDVSPSGASAVTLGSQVRVFVRGTDNRVWYATQAAAGGAFSPWKSVPGTVASAPAAMTWDGTRVDLFARGSNGHLLHTYSNARGFHAWEDLGGSLTSAPSAASLSTGTLDVVARVSGDSLARRRWDGTHWTAWEGLGGIISSAPTATADPAAGTVTVLARGRNANLYDLVLTSGGIRRAWTGSARQTWSAAGAAQGPAPLLVTRNDATPVVVNGSFATAIGGLLTGAPTVATRGSGSYVVLGRGTDGALWAYDGRAGRYRWSKVGGALR